MRTTLYVCLLAALLCNAVHCDHHGKDPKHKDDHDHGHHQQGRGHHDHDGHSHHHQRDEILSHKIAEKNAEFAFKLYKQLASQKDGESKNIFYSPLSISMALSMLSLGAKGATQSQIFEGLGFNDMKINETEVNEAFAHLLKMLNLQTELELSTGGAVYVHEGFKPIPQFIEDIKQFYHSEGFTVNFKNTSETMDIINKYVKDKTHGKITDLIKDLSPESVMLLVSYMFFKGKWEKPFEPNFTREDVFHVDAQTTVPVQMMSRMGMFDVFYDKELSTHVLKLPYTGNASLMLLMPQKGMKDLEEAWCKEHFTKWHRNVQRRRWLVILPKFSISATCSLQNVLSEMGITDVFSNTADLSGISEEVKLKVSKIVHSAAIDIDEKGTEAAAGTGIEIMPLSMPPTLKFNRPFLLVISNHNTNSILFMGKIVNPSEK
ncbi:alpha-1-antitrypsin-like isoform X2 [Polyodon spathula]|uniref:alpha-1-antitrypsin-like isoform X2 n=1 Tax=Polyodon spathula TaxID=7913 RepID=UPI001B7F28E4|nr:alpha-1-antitrypsin-like isoform X2 [Polyodon spathula]